jgi:hypothetical protein
MRLLTAFDREKAFNGGDAGREFPIKRVGAPDAAEIRCMGTALLARLKVGAHGLREFGAVGPCPGRDADAGAGVRAATVSATAVQTCAIAGAALADTLVAEIAALVTRHTGDAAATAYVGRADLALPLRITTAVRTARAIADALAFFAMQPIPTRLAVGDVHALAVAGVAGLTDRAGRRAGAGPAIDADPAVVDDVAALAVTDLLHGLGHTAGAG